MENGYYWIQQDKKRAEIGYYYKDLDSFMTIGSAIAKKSLGYTVHFKLDVAAFKTNPFTPERTMNGMRLSPPQWEVVDFLISHPGAYLMVYPLFRQQPVFNPTDPNFEEVYFDQGSVKALIRRGILFEFENRKYKVAAAGDYV
jgi:hypothetical protein